MSTANKIQDLPSLLLTVKDWRADHQKIVFTNGCFDLLHLGHLDYLEKSKQKGDKLIIGLNTDSSIKILKGENRPINNNEFRSKMLAALAFVDAIVLFSEETPKELISTLLPDILVKGSDYNENEIVGADIVKKNGGSVETVDLVKGFSSSNLIEKIKNS